VLFRQTGCWGWFNSGYASVTLRIHDGRYDLRTFVTIITALEKMYSHLFRLKNGRSIDPLDRPTNAIQHVVAVGLNKNLSS
jgi:hypothetical protein